MKVTFSDIMADYKMYRRSYFFDTNPNAPKQVYKRTQVHVDLDNFSLKEYFRKVIIEG